MDLITSSIIGRIALLTAIFLLVASCVMIVGVGVNRRTLVRRRVAAAMHEDAFGSASSLRAEVTHDVWTRLIDRIERRGLSLGDSKESDLAIRMAAAGYTSPYAVRWYTLLRLVLALGLPSLLVGLSFFSASRPSALGLYLVGVGAGLVGLYAPTLWISIRVNRRRETIIRQFPDALDLMLVCIEAGLGIEAAFDRVGREMSLSHPLISAMLADAVLEMRAGRNREEALRRMADHVGADEVKAFATLLIQSDKLGSSIGQSLRVYASEMRERRRLRAEEKAHRLPVLLSIPLVVCMLPVMIGVLMLPAVIRVVRQMLPTLTGG